MGSSCSGELGVKAVPSLWCVPHPGAGRWSSGHGERHPVVLLRADGGAWPVWLSPIQVLELEDEAGEWGPPGSDKCCGTHLSGWRERSKAGVATTFHMLRLTRRQHVELAWHATCAKVLNL